MLDVHFHVIVEYDGSHDVSPAYDSFTAAVEKARQEVATERLLDSTVPRKQRRKYQRREFIPGVYGEWIGSSINAHADPNIRIEVSTCIPAMHNLVN